ncbi:MAG: DUF2335 domain-containing protein [Candidatus Taylorbacteria bacterium]
MSNTSPNQQNSQPSGQSVAVRSQQYYSGPLPPPEVLKKFDEVVPGAAERIIKMAENQFAHRTELERKVIDSDIARSKWGQILGFLIAIAGLIGSVFISIYGSGLVGGIIGVGTLASLVGVFMYGSKTRRVERENKSREEREDKR